MTSHAEQLLSQLHKLLSDLEGLAKSAAGTAGEEAASRLKDTVESARSRIRDAEHDLQRNVTRGARAADDYVRENTWVSIGVAAAVGFLLGALSSRRDR